jgi:hypothetical protein
MHEQIRKGKIKNPSIVIKESTNKSERTNAAVTFE